MDECNKKENTSPETRLLHTAYPCGDAYRALNMPVYNSAAYEFDTAEEMEKAFTGRSPDHVYSRITNPTVQYFENRVKTVTGAFDVIALNSGMAAITNLLIGIGWAGCNIVTSPHLFGNTYSLLASTMAAFGIEARFCDLTDPEETEKAIDEKTCGLFLETITNPQLEVADLKMLSALCRYKKIPLIADTTIVPFTVFKAKEWGIDIEIVSTTKYVSGGATCLGGLLVDYATYDWHHSPKLKALAEQFGPAAFTAKMRKEVHRNLGSYMSPQTAAMQTNGMETMQIRFERAASTCLRLAEAGRGLPGIVSVNYPGLADNPFYELSTAQFGPYPGAMFTFDMASREDCFRFLNRLKLIRRATNLFDNKTLAIHPASTIYGNFTEESRRKMDVSQRTIRISVGLESAEDLLADFAQALSK